MGTRGPKSRKGLAVSVVATMPARPPAPAGMTTVQAAIWAAIVSSRPAGWFDAASAPLLAAYCEAAETRAVLAGAIAGFDVRELATDAGSGTYRRLVSLQAGQVKLLIDLATAMRLSQHAQRSADAAATAAREDRDASALWAGARS